MISRIRLKRPFNPDGGAAYIATPDLALQGALVFLLEDEKPLGPPDTEHQLIRELGGGWFSLWRGDVHFSASDNTDCNENGRDYQILALDGAMFENR